MWRTSRRGWRRGKPPRSSVPASPRTRASRKPRLRGSFVGNRRDMAEALAFAADGKVKADIELQPLSAINPVFERLARGEVPSRVVLDFAPQ